MRNFQGTFFRPGRRAEGAERFTSSAVTFGFRSFQGGRPCKGLSGQHAAAGRWKRGRRKAESENPGAPRLSAAHSADDSVSSFHVESLTGASHPVQPTSAFSSVTTTSHTFPSWGIFFRHSAGCRPVSHPVATVQTTAAHTCESTTKTKTTALEFAVANPAVTSDHGRVCGGTARVNLQNGK